MPVSTTAHIQIDDRGVPWIDGTNTKVMDVALDMIAHGWSPEEIHFQHAHLSMAQIHAEMDITDLPNADDGHMVPFVEVFPLGLALNFTFDQADWAADEAFCVQPSCHCTQTALSFLKLRNAAGEKTAALRHVPAIRYNYRSQAAEELARGLLGRRRPVNYLAALKMAVPSLDARLGLHHRIMQSLYARQYLERARLKKERLEAQLQVTPPRPGRNHPCPCGSAKKFKKCCGA